MLSFAFVAMIGSAQPERGESRTYDVSPAVTTGRDAEEIGKKILRSGIFEAKAKPRIVVRERNLIEVEGTAKQHGEVKDLLEALRRLADAAVDAKVDLIEFTPDDYKKSVLPLLEDGMGVITTDQAKKLAALGNAIQSSTARYGPKRSQIISMRQTLFADDRKNGYKLEAEFFISADRRSIHTKLREENFDQKGKPAPGNSGRLEVPDGGAILFRLNHSPGRNAWVVAVHTRIFIGDEEK